MPPTQSHIYFYAPERMPSGKVVLVPHAEKCWFGKTKDEHDIRDRLAKQRYGGMYAGSAFKKWKPQ